MHTDIVPLNVAYEKTACLWFSSVAADTVTFGAEFIWQTFQPYSKLSKHDHVFFSQLNCWQCLWKAVPRK